MIPTVLSNIRSVTIHIRPLVSIVLISFERLTKFKQKYEQFSIRSLKQKPTTISRMRQDILSDLAITYVLLKRTWKRRRSSHKWGSMKRSVPSIGVRRFYRKSIASLRKIFWKKRYAIFCWFIRL